MFFIFSKVLYLFILPLTWILALFIASFIIKKPKLKRRLLVTAVVLLFVFSNPFLFNNVARLWDIYPVKLKGPYSCVIVLGGFASEGPSGSGHFNGACDRFLEGLKLMDTHQASHILISGGNGGLIPDSFKEADWVKSQLKLFNVPDSCVLTEDKSRNTIENAAFSKIILEKKHLKPPYLLVTSAFHMRRSIGIFKKDSIAITPFPCDFTAGSARFSPDNFIPDADILGSWNIYIKEFIGTTVNLFRK